MFAVLSMTIKWATFQAIFKIDKNNKICIIWQNKSWTKVETTKDWNKIKGQIVKQFSSKNNENYLWHLLIKIKK